MNPFGLRPWQIPHAERLLAILNAKRAALDASDTGTGKTYSALAIAREMQVVPFVVGPKSARGAWEQASDVMGVPVEFVNYEKARGMPERVEVFNKKENRVEERLVAETDWLIERPWGTGSFLEWKTPYEFMVFEEVHRCGGMTSLNSKMLIAARRKCGKILALSATAADDPRQLKALGFALGLHELNGRRFNFISFLLRHGCRPGLFGGYEFTSNPIEQKKVFAKLHQQLFPFRAARMRKSEIPGFPKTQIEVRLLHDESGKARELAGKVRELYEYRRAQGLSAEGMEEFIRMRQRLEALKIPELVGLTTDYARSSKVAIFVNYTDTLNLLRSELKPVFGEVGFVDGTQVGTRGESERRRFLHEFQRGPRRIIVVNNQAGGEAISLHDPTGQTEVTTLLTPLLSARQLKQIVGRANRDGGGFSLQLMCYFADSDEARIAKHLVQRGINLDTLNDSDFN